MPPRDPDEYEGRRQQIIEGALQVFAHKGFEKATNKDIADAANIGSPGLIYHYFKDKADLLREVVESRAEAIRLLTHADALLSGRRVRYYRLSAMHLCGRPRLPARSR